MRVFVLGCGSIGRRHIHNLTALGCEVYAYDKDSGKLQRAVDEYKVKALNYTSQHMSIDAWIICCPPELHVGFGMMALQNNCHVFVEKPISHALSTPEGSVVDLIALAHEKSKVLQVGYQMRFSSSLQKVKELIDKKTFGELIHIYAEFGQYLPDWHPNEDYRLGYTAYTGILLDASHELDYVMWLAGSTVCEVKSMTSSKNPLDIQAESCADVLLRFTNGVVANVHVDMLQRGYERRCRVIMEREAMPWQFIAQKEDLYLKEMQGFLDCISSGNKPLVTGEDALEVLKIVLWAKGEV